MTQIKEVLAVDPLRKVCDSPDSPDLSGLQDCKTARQKKDRTTAKQKREYELVRIIY